MYCPTCGIDHHAAEAAEAAAADRDVELAKIQANRDITIARITASSATALAETENALDVARAEGQVEGMETVIESGADVGQADELAEPGAPIVVEAAEPEEPEAPAADMAPPEIVETSSPSSSSQGWWSGYR